MIVWIEYRIRSMTDEDYRACHVRTLEEKKSEDSQLDLCFRYPDFFKFIGLNNRENHLLNPKGVRLL